MQMHTCKYCTQIYAHHVTRMAKHLKICRGCPEIIKDQIRRAVKPKHGKKKKSRSRHGHRSSSSSKSSSTGSTASVVRVTADYDLSDSFGTGSVANKENETSQCDATDSSHRKATRKSNSSGPSTIKNFCDRMAPKDITESQKLQAKAIYSSGTPLTMTENPHWQTFFKHLRPAFPLPTRRQVSEKYLEDVYVEVKAEVDKKVMAASCVGLQCDGWSNIRNEGIVNVIVTTPEPVFFKSVPTGSNSETGAYIAAEMIKVIDEIGASKVLGICTDNASAVKSAWRILEEHYGPNSLVYYGCAAHVLNLLIKDIMKLPSVDLLTQNVKSIAKEVKNSHLLSSTLKSLQSKDPQSVQTTLKLPVVTRWGSIVASLQSICENKHNLQALAINPTASKVINRLTKAVLLDEEFWIRAQKILFLIEPVASWIKSLEGDTPKLSSVPEAFSELDRHFNKELKTSSLPALSSEESTAAIAAIQSRRSMAITPAHLAANILDPAYKGKYLSEEDQVSGSVLIHQLSSKFGLNDDKVLSELADYNSNEGLWSQSYVQQAASSTAPSKWWKGICHKTSLSKIAQELLNLPATSAATERTFSTQGWIHNAKRNRLNVDRAAMITYISHNMRLFNDNGSAKRSKFVARASTQTPAKSEGSDEGEDSKESAAETEYLDEEYLQEDI